MRRLTTLSAVVLAALLGLGAYSIVALARFDAAALTPAGLVYALGLRLAPGLDPEVLGLGRTLKEAGYVETRTPPRAPGQFHRAPNAWEIFVQAGSPSDPSAEPYRLRLELAADRIVRVVRAGREVDGVTLAPTLLGSLGGTSQRVVPVRLETVPPFVVDAILAAEDHRFLERRGIDLRALARAAWTNLKAGRIRQGGSTLTQQLVRTRLLGPERTLARKLQEAWLAALIESRRSKKEILEAYCDPRPAPTRLRLQAVRLRGGTRPAGGPPGVHRGLGGGGFPPHHRQRR